jgi:hypothetical protein
MTVSGPPRSRPVLSLNLRRAGDEAVRAMVPAMGAYAFLVVPSGTEVTHWWAAGTEIRAGRAFPADLPSWLTASGASGDLSGTVVSLPPAVRPVPGGSVNGHGVQVCLPEGTLAGALLVALRRPDEPPFSDPERERVADHARWVAVVMTAARLFTERAELDTALRAGLLPARLPAVGGLRLGAAFRPAGEAVRLGGDFIDVLPSGGDGAVCVLGDVCGKGLGAAVVGGRLRESLRALSHLVSDPVQLLGLLNRTLLGENADVLTQMASMVIGAVRPWRDGTVSLGLAAGGHVPPLIVRRDGRVERVAVDGMLVGVDAAARFGRARVLLRPGDSCVLYSDGVTEAAAGGPDGERFGVPRLAALLARYAGAPAEAVAQRVEQVVAEWLAGGDHDDITVLVLEAHAAQSGRAQSGTAQSGTA